MNQKIISELTNQYVERLQKEKNILEGQQVCTYFLTGKKKVLQRKYLCIDCFPNQRFGVCSYCMKNCHKGHHIKDLGKCRFFCDCAVVRHTFVQPEKPFIQQCVMYHIDLQFNQKLVKCGQCKIFLCYFCSNDSKHKEHILVDQSKQNHQWRSNTREWCEHDIRYQIESQEVSRLDEVSQKKQKLKIPNICQCTDQNHHQVTNMRKFLLKYKEQILMEQKEENFILPLFNFIFQNQDIYQNLLYNFNAHMIKMQQHLIDKNQAIICQKNSFLDFIFVKDNLMLLSKLQKDIQKRFLKLNNEFQSILTPYFIHSIITNISKLSANMDDLSIQLFEEVVQYLLEVYLVLIKGDVGGLRKIQTQSIENYSPLQRMMIRQTTAHYISKKYLIYNYNDISQWVIDYIVLISQLDISSFIQKKLLNFILQVIKIILKCRIIPIGKETQFIKQILEKLNNELQNNNEMYEVKLINERILTLMSDILILCYFHIKDLRFENLLVQLKLLPEQIQNGNEHFHINAEFGVTEQDEQNTPQNWQEQFLFSDEDQKIMTIFIILFGVILNMMQNKTFFKKNLENCIQLNVNVSKLLRQECFSSSLFYEQILKTSETEFNLYQQFCKALDEENVLRDPRENLQNFVNSFVLGTKSTAQSVSEKQNHKFTIQLITLIDDILQTGETNKFLVAVKNQLQFPLEKEAYLEFKEQLREFQVFIQRSHIKNFKKFLNFEKVDLTILRVFKYYSLIFPNTDLESKKSSYIFENMSPELVCPNIIVVRCLEFLKVYAFGNSLHQTFLFQKNNMEIFLQIMEQTNTYLEFSYFYYQLIMSLPSHEIAFINPLYILDHIQVMLEEFEKSFPQPQNVTSIKYTEIISIKIHLYSIIKRLLARYERRQKQKDDYQERSSINYYCFQGLSNQLLVTFKQLCSFETKPNSGTTNMSSSTNQAMTSSLFQSSLPASASKDQKIKEELESDFEEQSQSASNKRKNRKMNPKNDLLTSLKIANKVLRGVMGNSEFLIMIDDVATYSRLMDYAKTSEEVRAFKTIQLFLIIVKLLNVFLKNNDILLPSRNTELLNQVFGGSEYPTISEQSFNQLISIFSESEHFIDIQTELFRFCNFYFVSSRAILKKLEEKDKKLDNSNYIKDLMENILSIKKNVLQFIRLITPIMGDFRKKSCILKKMMKKSITYFQDHIYHAMFVPFENIISFTRFMGQVYLLSGEELQIIKVLVEEFQSYRDDFMNVMTKSQLPDVDGPESTQMTQRAQTDLYSIRNSKISLTVKEVLQIYEEQIVNMQYLKVLRSDGQYSKHETQKEMEHKQHTYQKRENLQSKNQSLSGKPIEKTVFTSFDEFHDLLKTRIEQLRSDDFRLIKHSAVYLIMQKKIKLKNFCQISNIFLTYVLNRIANPQKVYPYSQMQNAEFYIFNSIVNHVSLINKLLVFDTDLMQNFFLGFIEEEEKNKKLVLQVLRIILKQLPQLYSIIQHYDNNIQAADMQLIANQTIELLKIFRYLAEQQNIPLKRVLGSDDIFLRILKLTVDLFKTNQIYNLGNIQKQRQSQKSEEIETAPKHLGMISNSIIPALRDPRKSMVHSQSAGSLSSPYTQTSTLLSKQEISVQKASVPAQATQTRNNSINQNTFQTSFSSFENEDAQYEKENISPVFLKIFEYQMITLSELHLGPCQQNQEKTIEFFKTQGVWRIIIKVLSNNTTQNAIHVRGYVLDLILSLIDGASQSNLENISTHINFKILEEALLISFQKLVHSLPQEEFRKMQQNDDGFFQQIVEKLTYRYFNEDLGRELHRSLLTQASNIKIISSLMKLLFSYQKVSTEVQNYIQYYLYQINISENQSSINNRMIISVFHLFKNITNSVQYRDSEGQDQTYIFLIPPICQFMSNASKLHFNESVERTNWSCKITYLIENYPSLQIEMEENQKISQKIPFIANLSRMRFLQQNNVILLLTWINVAELIIYNFSMEYIQGEKVAGWQMKIVYSLELLCAFLGCVFFAFSLFLKFKIYQRIAIERLSKIQKSNLKQSNQRIVKQNKVLRSIYIYSFIMRQQDIYPYMLHIIMSLCGYFFNDIFIVIQSFLIVFVSKTMESYIEALKMRGSKFMGIFMLLTIIVNFYSFITFNYFANRYILDSVDMDGEGREIQIQQMICDTPLHCLLAFLHYGLRGGQGMAGLGKNINFQDENIYMITFIFDFTYMLVISLTLLNIINGIIIDAFADLRDQQSSIEYDIENICFICGEDRWSFERIGVQFKFHKKEIHNIWHYVNFLVYLGILGRDNANGAEAYIMQQLKQKELDWIPGPANEKDIDQIGD